MKIAVIGNMNNNGFAIMRYLRDLGMDAHLFLYANDGVGMLSHFRPEDDTWDIKKWEPFIHQTPVMNYPFAGLSGVWKLFNVAHMFLSPFRGAEKMPVRWISRRKTRQIFDGFDAYIGSGIAPAIFHSIGRKLDVFYPYATGVEHLGALETTSRLPAMGWLKKSLILKAMANQSEGILSSRYVFSAEFSLTKVTLKKLGKVFQPLAIPMVYREKSNDPEQYSSELRQLLERLAGKKYFLAISRQRWVRTAHMNDDEWRRESKNSDWVFRSFSRLCKERPNHGMRLLVAAYGPDVEASKELCRQLEIEQHVVWAPKLPRRELGILMNSAYAVIGEFKQVDEMIWGGVGWEALAAGKPLIHSFRFAPGRYEALYGTPPPPLLPAAKQEDVYTSMVSLIENPDRASEIGKGATNWFDAYNGAGLAEKWLEYICPN